MLGPITWMTPLMMTAPLMTHPLMAPLVMAALLAVRTAFGLACLGRDVLLESRDELLHALLHRDRLVLLPRVGGLVDLREHARELLRVHVNVLDAWIYKDGRVFSFMDGLLFSKG